MSILFISTRLGAGLTSTNSDYLTLELTNKFIHWFVHFIEENRLEELCRLVSLGDLVYKDLQLHSYEMWVSSSFQTHRMYVLIQIKTWKHVANWTALGNIIVIC